MSARQNIDFATTTTHMAARQSVDFNYLPMGQEKIDERLRNWARWSRGRGEGYPSTAAGFELYRSSDARSADVAVPVPIDALDAADVQKGVSALPINHRHAVHWQYINGQNYTARKMAQRVGESLEGLARLVIDGRRMLINRGV